MANNLMNRNEDFNDMRDLMGNFVDNFFTPRNNSWFNLRRTPSMKSDLTEDNKNYYLQVELPGLDKKNIKINYDNKNGILNISGKTNTSSQEKDKKKNIIKSERKSGSYERSYSIPSVKENGIIAKYDKGILSLTLPKTTESKNHQIEIQ